MLLLTSLAGPAAACTLWTAMGERAAGGGVLVAGTRDMLPNHRQELRVVKTPRAHRYLGLFAVVGQEAGLKIGVNEKGLVLASSAASCLSMGERKRAPFIPHLFEQLLASCATVEEVLARQTLFSFPAYYLVADPTQAVFLEVGLDGTRAILRPTRGTLAHTNHYLGGNLQDNNKRVGRSTKMRLVRIQELLAARRLPLAQTDFTAMTEDRLWGPDDSIWRTGDSPKKIRTLAAWSVGLPPDGPPTLYFKIANPGESAAVRQLSLDAAFWEKAGPGVISGITPKP